MRRLLLGFVLSAVLMWAQKPPEPDNKVDMVAAVIPVKTLSGDAFHRLERLLNAFNVRIAADERLRTFVVYAPKDVVEQIKRVVQELDRPGSEAAVGRNIDLTLSFLRCSLKPGADAPAPLPTDLESVAKQLRAATPYKVIELWDVLPLRIQEGKETVQTARLPSREPGSKPSTARVIVKPEAVSVREAGRSVRFDRFDIGFHVAYKEGPGPNYQFIDVGVSTSGEFKESQKTVIGKIGLDDESAVFAVVALKVLD